MANRVTSLRKLLRFQSIADAVDRHPTMHQHFRHTHRRHNMYKMMSHWRAPHAYYFYGHPHRLGFLKAAAFVGAGVAIGSVMSRKSKKSEQCKEEEWDKFRFSDCGRGKFVLTWDSKEVDKHEEGCTCQYCYFCYLQQQRTPAPEPIPSH